MSGISGALTRYRIMAWITGVLLLVLVFVAMPMKYFGGSPELVVIVGTAHGWLYMIYLITGVDLTFRMRWSLWSTAGVLIAGTIPFASFFAEHWVTKRVRERIDNVDVRSKKQAAATSTKP